MSVWVRLLVVVPFSTLVGLALVLTINGKTEASSGALVLAGLISPLLLEVFWPGRYALRKPDGDVADNLVNRLGQFRRDHPRWDGTFLLGIIVLVGTGCLAGSLLWLLRLLISG